MDGLFVILVLIIAISGFGIVGRLLYRRNLAKKAVIRLAHDLGADVKECWVTGRNGLERVEAYLKYCGYPTRIGAGSAVSIDMQGFKSTVAFALGTRELIGMMDQPRESHPLLTKLSLFVNPNIPNSTLEWLAVEDNVRAVAALNCSRREPLFVWFGGFTAVVRADRATVDTLSRMTDLINRLELSAPQPVSGRIVEGLRLDPDQLPEDLRGLMPLIEVWAIGDDGKRQWLLQAASPEERDHLIKTVRPLLNRINTYLDSFSAHDEIPEEAILVGWLAEAVTELGG